MAEPKTSQIFVRLTRDFPVGQSHRRGGVELIAGPRPVSVEVTDEQLAAIEADRYIEIVDDAEAKKWEDRLGQPEAPTSSDLEEAASGNQAGRNYGEGDQETDEQKAAREAAEAEKERRATIPTVDELIADNNRDALVAKATEAGVEGIDFADTKAATKKVIAEAIVAKRDASSDEE